MKKWKRKLALLSGLALTANQAAGQTASVLAANLEYEGTTQMASDANSLTVENFASELVVEEVYAEAGSSIQEGDQVLKLTSESYQEALDYYAAAILRAENSLTDTQREYDQGVLAAKYEYEEAKTKSDQAEFIKEYQQQELEDTIAAHEEMIEDLEERIAELESGIADGSYDTSSGSSSSGSSSSGGSSSGGQSGGESESELESESESGSEISSDGLPQTESGAESENNSEMSSDNTLQTENGGGTGRPDTTPETESNASSGTESQNGSNDGQNGAQPDTTPETESESSQETESDVSAQISSLKQQLEENSAAYNEILTQLNAALAGSSTESSTESTEGETESGTEDSAKSELATKLKASVESDTTLLGHMKNIQEMLKNIPDELLTFAISIDAITEDKYKEYTKLLDTCVEDMTKNLETQNEILETLEESDSDSSEETENAQETQQSVDADTVQTLLEKLSRNTQERTSLYGQLVSLLETQLSQQETQIASLQEQLQAQQATETQQTTETQTESESNANGGFPQSSSESGESSGFPQSGSDASSAMSGFSSGSFSSSSLPSGSASASSGSTAAVSGSTAAVSGTSGSGSMSMEDLNLTEEDISLFGDTYDLSQMESLLEQEPASTDNAEELLEQLEDSLDTVEKQYAELTRNQKATKLGIQYTYDTSILSGELAEITYQQELKEWETTLSDAKEAVETLEETEALLEEMTDGVLTAKTSGTVAAVNYEADDALNAYTAVLTYYDTSEVYITIAVPQEEVAQIQVCDTAQVTISGMMELTGTVTEKSPDPEDGTSRTTVNYDVTVTIENESGMLSSGTAATVTFAAEDGEAQEGQTEAAEETGDTEAQTESREETGDTETQTESREETKEAKTKAETEAESNA